LFLPYFSAPLDQYWSKNTSKIGVISGLSSIYGIIISQ